CTFVNGVPNGPVRAWRADGSLLAAGSVQEGGLIGTWSFHRDSTEEELEFEQARPRATFAGEWSPASIADRPGCLAVETWLAEMCSPRQPAPLRSAPVTTPAEHALPDAES